MIFRTTLYILIILASISYADFDDSIIWRYYIPEVDSDGNNFTVNKDGISTMFLHSNLYGMSALNWNFISAQYRRGKSAFGMEFSSLGYEDYYQRNKYRTRVEYRFHDYIEIAPLIEITEEKYGDFGRYTRLSGEFYIDYSRRNYYAGFGLTAIPFKEPYDKSHDDRINPFIFGSWILDEGLVLSIGVRRFENRRTRWIFDQFVLVNEHLALNFGYKNKPSDIYGGLLLTVKKFSFTITYSSVSGLSDSVIWGFNFRG